ncbi:MAG: hypothetical protein JNM68_09455 [Dinghuibacter sp.]|nr:hypothetical protein [Dinghuibacter sp.]
MNRIITTALGILLAAVFLLALPYLLLGGLITFLLVRFWVRNRVRRYRKQSHAGRYQQAYARHWQHMTPEERQYFMNRFAPEVSSR